MVLHPFAQVIEMDVTMALWYSVRGRNLEPQVLDKNNWKMSFLLFVMPKKMCQSDGLFGFEFLGFLQLQGHS